MTDNFEFKGNTEVIHGITFEDVPSEAQILAARRAELGLSQQEVADKARILLRQYQRFESGSVTFPARRSGLPWPCATLWNWTPIVFAPLSKSHPLSLTAGRFFIVPDALRHKYFQIMY